MASRHQVLSRAIAFHRLTYKTTGVAWTAKYHVHSSDALGSHSNHVLRSTLPNKNIRRSIVKIFDRKELIKCKALHKCILLYSSSRCFQHSVGSVNWLPCLCYGYNVMILWDQFGLVTLFKNIYANRHFYAGSAGDHCQVPDITSGFFTSQTETLTWLSNPWRIHSLQCWKPD